MAHPKAERCPCCDKGGGEEAALPYGPAEQPSLLRPLVAKQ
jgi:hypothetical protein